MKAGYPTGEEIEREFTRIFPHAALSPAEKEFLRTIASQRLSGTGFGWMRQAIGLAWRLADPRGYIDDARIREFAVEEERERVAKKRRKGKKR